MATLGLMASDAPPQGTTNWPEKGMGFFLYIYMLRVQVLGLLFLYPAAGWALQTPLFRGLADLRTDQIKETAIFSAGISILIAMTAKLVFLWGKARVAPRNPMDDMPKDPDPKQRRRQVVSFLCLVWWVLFMSDVHSACNGRGNHCSVGGGTFWLESTGCYLTAWGFALVCEVASHLRFGAVRPIFLTPGVATINRILLRRPEEFLASARTSRHPYKLAQLKPSSGLSAGYLAIGPDTSTVFLPGHLPVFFLGVLLFLAVEYRGLVSFAPKIAWLGAAVLLMILTMPFIPRYWKVVVVPVALIFTLILDHVDKEWFGSLLRSQSTLGFVLMGVLLGFLIAAALSFFVDRYRISVVVSLLLLTTICAYFGGTTENYFYSEPAAYAQRNRALTPAEVLRNRGNSPIIVVSAAGGGIQATAWTAQVLAGLRADEQTGSKFAQEVTVLSGVSGGSVGVMFFLGTYKEVWGHETLPSQIVDNAMGSSLMDVAAGALYSDLHHFFLPFPTWSSWSKDRDRGWALERSFAERAGRSPGPRLLDLAPAVKAGFPVVIFNSTLSEQGLPVVFSNSKFPSPDASPETRRNITSFENDLFLDTRIETAARMSATFPFVSPAARPTQLRSRDAYLDGGYFDNSGLYSLMAWLEEAQEQSKTPKSEPDDTRLLEDKTTPLNPGVNDLRRVLLIQISAFPEPPSSSPSAADMPWYKQFWLPLETVMKVRETGQGVRVSYEVPIQLKSLASFDIERAEFRYKPSPRCSLEDPPLSWHLSEFEKGCIQEGWGHPGILVARKKVSDFLSRP
jgi:hypothetical protein